MTRKTTCLLFAFFFKVYLTNAQVVINGMADKYYAKQFIKAFTYSDYISQTPVLMGQTQIDANGNFNLQVNLNATSFLFLKIKDVRIEFYAEKDSAYQLTLKAPDSASIQRVNQDLEVEYFLKGGKLNKEIARINLENDYFFTTNYLYFVKRSAKTKVDSLKRVWTNRYQNAPEYLANYVKFTLASLELAAYKGEKYIFENYYQSPIQYANKDYFDFYSEFFKHYLFQFAESKKGEGLKNAINKQNSYTAAYELFKRDKNLTNDTLRELVFITGLYELYYSQDYDIAKVLECIKYASNFATYENNKRIAKAIYTKLTLLQKGNPAPAIKLTDIYFKDVSLEEYQDKVIILSFGASWCTPYLAELKLLEKYSRDFGKKVIVLNVLIDEPSEDIFLMQKRNKNWRTATYTDMPEILDAYRVKSVPVFYIISKSGAIYEGPAEVPSKWPIEKFEALKKLK